MQFLYDDDDLVIFSLAKSVLPSAFLFFEDRLALNLVGPGKEDGKFRLKQRLASASIIFSECTMRIVCFPPRQRPRDKRVEVPLNQPLTKSDFDFT